MSKQATAKQAEANRRNARRSSGPRSANGKAVSAQNARRHGLLSALEVLPHERQEDWTRHLQQTCEALRPEGYLEELLVERIALACWRLGRVARCEQAAGADNVLRFTHELAEATAEATTAREDHALLAHLTELDGTDAVDAKRAVRVLERVAHLGSVDLYAPDFPGSPDEVALEDLRWDVEHLRQYVRLIADHAHAPFEEIPEAYAIYYVARAEQKLRPLEEAAARRIAQRGLPHTDTLDKLTRYETTIERSLFRTLHELERLQVHRAGGTVPPPLAIDMTCDNRD